MPTDTVASIKSREARRRLSVLRQAKRSPQAARQLHRQVSAVGDGRQWRITNFPQAFAAMGRWAKER